MDAPSSSDASSALATPPPLLATTPILQPPPPTHPHTPPLRPPADPPPFSSEFHFLAPITRRSAPCSHLPPTSPVSFLLPASSLGVVGLLSCRRAWCIAYVSCSYLRRFDRFPPTNHTLAAPPCIPPTRTVSLSPPPTSRVGFPRAPSFFSRTPLCSASATLCLVERTASPRIAANSLRRPPLSFSAHVIPAIHLCTIRVCPHSARPFPTRSIPPPRVSP